MQWTIYPATVFFISVEGVRLIPWTKTILGLNIRLVVFFFFKKTPHQLWSNCTISAELTFKVCDNSTTSDNHHFKDYLLETKLGIIFIEVGSVEALLN